MKRFLLYAVIGVVAFLACAVIFAPASAIWMVVSEDVETALPALRVSSIDGTIWSGSGNLQYRAFPASRLEWRVNPLSLLYGDVSLDMDLSGDGHRIQGTGLLGGSQLHIRQLTGYLHSEYVNAVSEDFGLTFSGQLEIHRLSLTVGEQWISRATGDLAWDGGRVVFRSGDHVQVFELPPLTGRLSMQERLIRLDVDHQRASLLAVILKPTGWVEVNLKTRLFRLAGLASPAGLDPDDTLLRVEEKIFAGTGQAGG